MAVWMQPERRKFFTSGSGRSKGFKYNGYFQFWLGIDAKFYEHAMHDVILVQINGFVVLQTSLNCRF